MSFWLWQPPAASQDAATIGLIVMLALTATMDLRVARDEIPTSDIVTTRQQCPGRGDIGGQSGLISRQWNPLHVLPLR